MPGIRHYIAFGSFVAAIVAAAFWLPARADDQTVSIENIAFVPNSVTISVGDTVTWVHNDDAGIPHTVTSTGEGPLLSGSLSQGQTFQFTFNTPGTYNYHCTIHPTVMTGTVIVEEPTLPPTPTEVADTPTPTPALDDTPTPTPAVGDTPTPTPAVDDTPTPTPGVGTPEPTATTAVGTPAATATAATTPAPPAVGLGTMDKGGTGWLMPLLALVVIVTAGAFLAMRTARNRSR